MNAGILLSHRWSNQILQRQLSIQLHKTGINKVTLAQERPSMYQTQQSQQQDNSGGIRTTGGGTMNTTNLTVNTAGNYSGDSYRQVVAMVS